MPVTKIPIFYRVVMYKVPGFGFENRIALSEKYYDEFYSGDDMSCRLEALLEHELVHAKRIGKFGGNWRFDLKYWSNKEFRFQEELIAIKAGMKVYKKHNKKYPIKRTVWNLSSWPYLWAVSKERALEEFNKAWREA